MLEIGLKSFINLSDRFLSEFLVYKNDVRQDREDLVSTCGIDVSIVWPSLAPICIFHSVVNNVDFNIFGIAFSKFSSLSQFVSPGNVKTCASVDFDLKRL